MHHSRRSFLRALTLAGCAASLPLSSGATSCPDLPAGLAEAVNVYGDILGWKRTSRGLEASVRIRNHHHLAKGFDTLCRFGKMRAGGNDLRIESTAGSILLRHTACR